MLRLRLKPTKQSEDKKRFPCCGLPSNHTHKRLGGSSVGTNQAYQLSQIKELLSRTCGLPYVSSQGYNVVPKSKSKSKSGALGGSGSGSGKGVCKVSQIRELLERTIVR